jgi:hypothetical protein
MLLRKSITKMSTPTFEKSGEKVGVSILVIDFISRNLQHAQV